MPRKRQFYTRLALTALALSLALVWAAPLRAAAMKDEPGGVQEGAAAAEVEIDWDAALAEVELTGDYAEDLVRVALSQLGYTESAEDHEVGENGAVRGYTRYGDWYGDPYGDWCAIFVSFCLYSAGVPEEVFPRDRNCADWIRTLLSPEYGLYIDAAAGYEPGRGDLVFFDWDGDGSPDHVGIVVEQCKDGSYSTVNGNLSDQVRMDLFSAEDAAVLGYGVLPDIGTTEQKLEASAPLAGEEESAEIEPSEAEDVSGSDPLWAENGGSAFPVERDAGQIGPGWAVAAGCVLLALFGAALFRAMRSRAQLERIYRAFERNAQNRGRVKS